MKSIITIILLVLNIYNLVEDKPKQIVKSFLHELFTNELSFTEMYQQDLLYTSEEYSNLESKSSADSLYNMVLLELKKEVVENQKSRIDDLEILTIEEGIEKKNYNERLNIPDQGQAFLIYKENTLLTRILVLENRIASFSVINKGGTRYFMLI